MFPILSGNIIFQMFTPVAWTLESETFHAPVDEKLILKVSLLIDLRPFSVMMLHHLDMVILAQLLLV